MKAIKPLDLTSSKQVREEYKNQAVEIRESGDLLSALEMFKQVLTWDETNLNINGKLDILGHIRITLSRMAEEETEHIKKQGLVQQAVITAENALEEANKHTEVKEGTKTIQKVHLASALAAYSEYESDGEAKTQLLNKSLYLVEEALENFPGSDSHKAWPLNVKAKVLYYSVKYDEALDMLNKAEVQLLEGYKLEKQKDDQFEHKINSWMAGIFLTKAQIFLKKEAYILANYYAKAILAIEDPQNILGERKKEANRILLECLNS